jgi:hypothetical protein
MPNIVERSYYSGQDSSPPFVVDTPPFHKLPQAPSIPGLIAGGRVSVEISYRIDRIQDLVTEASNAYYTERSRYGGLSYFFAVESLLISMRRVIDDAVMSVYCSTHKEEVAKSKRVAVDGYGGLFKAGRLTAFGRQFFSQYVTPNEEALEVLVDLSNSYKHSYLLPESRAWGVDFPTVLTIHAPRNDYSKEITYHNHSLGQIVIAFNQVLAGFVKGEAQRPRTA